jgi:hypothetical protein
LSGKKEEGRLAAKLRSGKVHTAEQLWQSPRNRRQKAQPRPDPNEKLVKVFESEEETEALVVKGLLESASIESDVAPLSLTQYAFPNIGGTIILVREENAETARRMIAEYRQKQPDADEEAEENSTEEPPATV